MTVRLADARALVVGDLARRAGAGRVRERMIAARNQQVGETPGR
jgi:hypothetical protein